MISHSFSKILSFSHRRSFPNSLSHFRTFAIPGRVFRSTPLTSDATVTKEVNKKRKELEKEKEKESSSNSFSSNSSTDSKQKKSAHKKVKVYPKKKETPRLVPYEVLSFDDNNSYMSTNDLFSSMKIDLYKNSSSSSLNSVTSNNSLDEPDRPFTLPSGTFRPKQSLGQNFLTDQNTVLKFIGTFYHAIYKNFKKKYSHFNEEEKGILNRDEVEEKFLNEKDQYRNFEEEKKLKKIIDFIPSQINKNNEDSSISYNPNLAFLKGMRNIVEVGPGAGALTRTLLRDSQHLSVIEVDEKSVKFMKEKFGNTNLNVIHQDVLTINWKKLSETLGGKICIVANLPYHIVSQVLFTLADYHEYIELAVVSMQLEVGERIVAAPNSKAYGIPSVVFQLYSEVEMNMKIPPHMFYPKPKVDSVVLTFNFNKKNKRISEVDLEQFRKVVTMAFRQRRKMLRKSLSTLIEEENLILPSKWENLRPEQLKPEQFIDLTKDLYFFHNNNKENTNKKQVFSWRGSLKLDNNEEMQKKIQKEKERKKERKEQYKKLKVIQKKAELDEEFYDEERNDEYYELDDEELLHEENFVIIEDFDEDDDELSELEELEKEEKMKK